MNQTEREDDGERTALPRRDPQPENRRGQVNLNGKTQEEIQRLLDALQIHQMELETQHQQLMATQHALQKSEAKYRNLYQLAPNGYLTLQANGAIQEANVAAATLLNSQGRWLPGHLLRTFVAPVSRTAFDNFFQLLLTDTGLQQCEVELNAPANTSRRALLQGAALSPEESGSYLVCLIDLTEQILTRKQLSANETLLREAESIGHTGSYEGELATMTFRFSDGMFRLLGHEPQTFTPTLAYINSISYPGDAAAVLQVLERAIATKEPYHYLRRIYLPSGEMRYIASQGKVLYNERGEAIKILGIAHDITEQKRAEEEINQQAHFIRQVTEAIPGSISIYDFTQQRIVYLNRQQFPHLGYNEQELKELTNLRWINQILHPNDQTRMRVYIEEMSQTPDDQIRNIDYRIRHKDNSWEWRRMRAKVFQRDASGRPQQYISLAENITKEKQAEQELIESRELLQAVFDASNSDIVVHQAIFNQQGEVEDFEFVLVNNHAKATIGATDPIGQRYTDLFPGIIENGLLDHYKNVIRTGEPMDLETPYVGQGIRGWFRVTAHKLGDQLVVTAEEITARKEAEEKVHQQAHFINRIADTIPDIVSVIELSELQLEYINRESFKWQDFDFSSLQQMNAQERIYQMVHPEDVAATKEYFHGFTSLSDQDIRLLEYRAQNLLGEWVWLRARGKVFLRNAAGQPTHCVNVVQNITQQKRAEEEIRKHLTLLQQSEELAGMGSWEYDRTTGQFQWSEGMYRLFGLPQQSIVALASYSDFAVQEDQPIARRVIAQIQGRNSSFEEVMRIRVDGEVRTLKIKATVVRIQPGKPEKVLGVDLDITAIREAEKQLRESETLLNAVFEASPIGIIVLKSLRNAQQEIVDFQYLLANQEARKQRGIRKLPGERYGKAHLGTNAADVFDAYVRVVTTGTPFQYDRHQHRAGQLRWHSVTVVKFYDGLVVTSQDITDRKRLEAETLHLKASRHQELAQAILQAQEEEKWRLSEALHNGLAQQLYAVHLRLQGIKLEKLPEAIEEVRNSKNLAEKLLVEAITQTRTLSHELTPMVLEKFSLQDAIEEFCEQMNHEGLQLRCQVIGIEKSLEKYLEIVLYRISQELVNNIVKHSQASVARILIQPETTPKGKWICLQARDNGKGFDVSQSRKKALGLQTIQSRVDLLGGTMHVKSQPGNGTLILIRLPMNTNSRP